jgi:hypothetical protein
VEGEAPGRRLCAWNCIILGKEGNAQGSKCQSFFFHMDFRSLTEPRRGGSSGMLTATACRDSTTPLELIRSIVESRLRPMEASATSRRKKASLCGSVHEGGSCNHALPEVFTG